MLWLLSLRARPVVNLSPFRFEQMICLGLGGLVAYDVIECSFEVVLLLLSKQVIGEKCSQKGR